MMKKFLLFNLLFVCSLLLNAQTTELSNGWKAIKASEISLNGSELTSSLPDLSKWIDATVPGTVLTTLLNNKLIPDPYYGMNNEKIPDISVAGRDYYTYWFFNQFSTEGLQDDKQVWINFRGINYSADVYINGHRLTEKKHEGMFLRLRFNVTRYLNKDGKNFLAVLVEPPLNTGKPNGGQGGDGLIGKDVTMQFTPGWDWIQPVRDRNTGIWDKVTVEITGPVDIEDPFVKVKVPGVRLPGELQEPVYITLSTMVSNTTDQPCEGYLKVNFSSKIKKQKILLEPHSEKLVVFDEIRLTEPRLWWPNGMGPQYFYVAAVSFELKNGSISDRSDITFGLREIGTYFDEKTGSRVFTVNGQKLFIKGGNWIASDALLRLSPERYNAEIKMHADMNMNTIRVWGGSMTERPEFYEACDKNGILVWQDLWTTGDCNGRWEDKLKAESQEKRRLYPDDHDLFISSVVDQVKLLRNHPSLMLWCGGNEFPPAPGLNEEVKKAVDENDGTRYYLDQSTSADLLKYNSDQSGDGPYTIQEPSWFFTQKWYSFNPEMGSVGLPNIENMSLIMDKKDIVVPDENNLNEVWRYHKYDGYGKFIDRFGPVTSVEDFFMKAQILGYDQYRAIQEGYNNHMWDWYTGMIIWKSQNPWTALKGQFYDWFLDPNATYYGYRHGTTPIHGQYNPADSSIYFINATPKAKPGLRLEASLVDPYGKTLWKKEEMAVLDPNSVMKKWKVDFSGTENGISFLRIKIIYTTTETQIDENTYWIPSEQNDYSALTKLPQASINGIVVKKINDKYIIEVNNSGNSVAFFIRLKVSRSYDGRVVTPVMAEDNYFTLMPGEKRDMTIDLSLLSPENKNIPLVVEFSGINIKPVTMLL